MLNDNGQKPAALQHIYSIFVSQTHANQLNYTKLNFQLIANLPGLKSFSYTTQNILLVALITSLSIGTYFKLILYRYFWRCRRDKSNSFKNRPINVMILLGAIIHHGTHHVVLSGN